MSKPRQPDISDLPREMHPTPADIASYTATIFTVLANILEEADVIKKADFGRRVAGVIAEADKSTGANLARVFARAMIATEPFVPDLKVVDPAHD